MQTQSDYVLGEFPRIKGFALFEQFSGHHARSQGPGQGVGAGVVALAGVGILTISLSFEAGIMNGSRALVPIEGGWTWADNELAQQAKKEFEAALYAMQSDRTVKLMGNLMAEALGAGIDDGHISELMIDIVAGAAKKLEADSNEQWVFIKTSLGLELATPLIYRWPQSIFSINTEATDNA